MSSAIASPITSGILFCTLLLQPSICDGQQNGIPRVVQLTNSCVVKISGSGGFQGLEPYQTGFLISSDGYVLTAWSYVLDSEKVSVTLADGHRFTGVLKGYHPKLEIALLKIDGNQLTHFNLDEAVDAKIGQQILAFSNLYKIATGDEPVSVQAGVVSAITGLRARRGAFSIPYDGPVYVMDAMTNNPGAAGGPVTNTSGQLIGMIGKEVRDRQTNAWLNFAVPIDQLAGAVEDIRDGRIVLAAEAQNAKLPDEPINSQLLGFSLVTDVVSRTPPFVDRVDRGSVAERSGLRQDDLIVEVNGKMTPTCRDVVVQLRATDRDTVVVITIQRGQNFEAIKMDLQR